MISQTAVLFSIKPKYVSLISSGEKKYELRRKCPKVTKGDLALVYESSPTMSLVGAFLIGNIIQKPPLQIWNEIGKMTGTSYQEFMDYFDGCDIGSAIEIDPYWQLQQSISLAEIRSLTQLEPPQSFRYICRDMIGRLFDKTGVDVDLQSLAS